MSTPAVRGAREGDSLASSGSVQSNSLYRSPVEFQTHGGQESSVLGKT